MHDSLLTALDGLKRTVDQFLPALGQHLHTDIVRNQSSVHKLSEKIELNLARRRKSDFDLLKSKLDQIEKHFHLLFHDHGIDQRLIPIAQIHAAPDGCLLDFLIWPLPFGIVYHRIFPVSPVVEHLCFSFPYSCIAACGTQSAQPLVDCLHA